jgi:hypothetical protein
MKLSLMFFPIKAVSELDPVVLDEVVVEDVLPVVFVLCASVLVHIPASITTASDGDK